MSEQTPHTHERFETWAIVELMGHRRIVGRVTEQEIAGHGFLRLDVPDSGGEIVQSQFVSPASVYAITPVSEEAARLAARSQSRAPITVWELPANIRKAVFAAEEREHDDDLADAGAIDDELEF